MPYPCSGRSHPIRRCLTVGICLAAILLGIEFVPMVDGHGKTY